ncbi:MAG TPA: hypothetical protein VMT89_13070, partial [Candidatus Acidoferrales bacterium]|nr:hypothetical protein [Candidatus Acidoferrales bacterium]
MTAQAAQSPAWRRLLSFGAKLLLTAGALYLLLTHPVRNNDGESIIALRAILDYLPRIDPTVFWTFALAAFLVRAVGIACSMVRWTWLLRGQGIDFPGWHIVTTFLIG